MDEEMQDQGGTRNLIDSCGNSSNLNDGVALDLEKAASASENYGNSSVDVRNSRPSDRLVYQEKSDGHQTFESLNYGTSSSASVDGIVLERVAIICSVGNSWTPSLSGENKDVQINTALTLSNSGQEIQGERGDSKATAQVELGRRSGSDNSGAEVVLETVIVINSEEGAGIRNQDSGIRHSDLWLNKINVDKSKMKIAKGQKPLYIADVKRDGDNGGGGVFKDDGDGERLCRICHLSSESFIDSPGSVTSSSATCMDLIQLGCGCKDELGTAHAHCAEAWFKLKGNRICEICGEMAKNVTVVRDSRFMEDWNQRRFMSGNSSLSDRGATCWRGQPFCTFLMACLVIAFVLPWFLRVNMF